MIKVKTIKSFVSQVFFFEEVWQTIGVNWREILIARKHVSSIYQTNTFAGKDKGDDVKMKTKFKYCAQFYYVYW